MISRENILSGIKLPKDLRVGRIEESSTLPEKILQFGEGNFLRAFVDYMVDELNSQNLFNGSVVVVQPIKNGLADEINKQDGLYTVVLRGLEEGKEVSDKKLVTSISRAINPYDNFTSYIECANNPDLRFVVSNTTEAGITYNDSDKLSDKPQNSFPGKVTAFLYERFNYFKGAEDKGLVFIPCELIDNNGTALKEIVLRYAQVWNLGQDFITWVTNHNYFTNTLVDRIVTGYPAEEADQFTEELGYKDKLLNTAEIFHFWVIEGADHLSEEIPFHKVGLNVLWTDNATPYKMRKVRILNGAHTMSVLLAYLAGKNTVLEIMQDEDFRKLLEKGLFDEIIPTLDLDYADLKSFADAVFDRFANPYIRHLLLSISLNSVSKYRTRVLPSILEYYNRKDSVPEVLAFSFAGLLAFYRGSEIRDNVLIGARGSEQYNISDDIEVLELFKSLWASCDLSESGVQNFVTSICADTNLWGANLNDLPGFNDAVSKYLLGILENGALAEVKKLVGN